MRLYVYFNDTCMPEKNIGDARYFKDGNELTKTIVDIVKQMAGRDVSKYRVFVTEDDIQFDSLDHFVLFDDEFKIGDRKKIEELPLKELSEEYNAEVIARKKAVQDKIAELKKLQNDPTIVKDAVLEADKYVRENVKEDE